MSMTDPVADMLTRIRNATIAGHRRVDIPASTAWRKFSRMVARSGIIVSRLGSFFNSAGRLRPESIINVFTQPGHSTDALTLAFCCASE